MRFPRLILASVLLFFFTACGGDGNGEDGDSPSATESSQSQEGSPSEGADPEDSTSSEDSDGSSDGDDGPKGEEGGSTEDLEAAFTEYTVTFFTGKPGDAYGFISARCQKEIKAKDFGESAEGLAEAFGAEFELTITDSDVQDGRGKVEAEYGSPELNQALATDKYDWIYEGGGWFLDGCA